MSSSKSQQDLHTAILSYLYGKNFVLLCLGNEIRGDDEIGISIGNQLREKLPDFSDKIIIAHTVPASYLGKISSLNPDSILVIDAADFGETPGIIALFDYDIIEELSYSTHFQEYDRLLAFLEMEVGHPIECKILAIQIKETTLLDPICEDVAEAGVRIIEILTQIIGANLRK